MFEIPLSRLSPSPSTSRPIQSGRVWILEDSPLEAEMARRALATTHEVELFSDGHVVLERIANGARPSVLVLDSQLPSLLGIEVCRLIRASYDEMALPILMLTIEGQRASVVAALAAGANDYLTKPYDVSELLARVGVLVRTSHLHTGQVRRARHVELAAEVGLSLARGGDVGELARACASSIAKHIGAPLAALYAVRGGQLTLEASAGSFARVAQSSPHVLEQATRASVGKEPFVTKVAGALATDLPAADSVVAVPLVLDERVNGVLLIASPKPMLDEDVDALRSLAQLVALGLERIRIERERADLLERELRARTEAEAATRAKDEFLALVSHELRTPLHAILGWSELLRQQDGVQSFARGLDVIRRCAVAQAALIDDLLDVTRIISGKLRIDRGPVDLVDLVENVVESLRPSATKASLTLTTTIALESASLRGDAARLKQVTSNLLTNAIKFTPVGGKIEVSLRRDGAWFELVVSDTGKGIHAEFLPRIFERFWQADGTMRRRHGGLGLGLSIVSHIAELHGGTVTAHSDGEEKGSTFTVRIPVGGLSSHPHADDEPSSLAPDTIDGVSVLYVDDDADALEFVARTLTDAGAKVSTASSVNQALELLAMMDDMPSVIVSDVGMPEADGFMLVRKIRQLPKERGLTTPLIALTAYGHIDDRIRSEAAGFDVHLTKPIAPLELVAAIGRVLQQHRH